MQQHEASPRDGALPSPSSDCAASLASIISVCVVSLDFYKTRPNLILGDLANSASTGKALRQVPAIRVFGHNSAGQSACIHVHGVMPYFYVQVPIAVSSSEQDGFLHDLAEGLEHAMALHQNALAQQGAHHFSRGGSEIAYVYDKRWVTGWKSVYGFQRSDPCDNVGRFVQIWAVLPNFVPLMAHLLQQGAVMSIQFQPFEVHLPYTLHFLDMFGLGGMKQLHLSRALIRGKLPQDPLGSFPAHPLWRKQLGAHAETVFKANLGVWSERSMVDVISSPCCRITSCELELDCCVADILTMNCAPGAPPAMRASPGQTPGATLGLSPASHTGGDKGSQTSVHTRTKGWICDTLQELWRDEELWCNNRGKQVPWNVAEEELKRDLAEEALPSDIYSECLQERLRCFSGVPPLSSSEHSPASVHIGVPTKAASNDSVGLEASPLVSPSQCCGAWSQLDAAPGACLSKLDDVRSTPRVSSKFIKAVERLEVALSQGVPMAGGDDATSKLLTEGYTQGDVDVATVCDSESEIGDEEEMVECDAPIDCDSPHSTQAECTPQDIEAHDDPDTCAPTQLELTPPDQSQEELEILEAQENADAQMKSGIEAILDPSTSVPVVPGAMSPIRRIDLFGDVSTEAVAESRSVNVGKRSSSGQTVAETTVDVKRQCVAAQVESVDLTDTCRKASGKLEVIPGTFSLPGDLQTVATGQQASSGTLEHASVWQYWRPPPPYSCAAAKSGHSDGGLEVITRFDNAGRLTTLQKQVSSKDDVFATLQKDTSHEQPRPKRPTSFSQVTPATPAAPKVLQPSANVLFCVMLSLEIFEAVLAVNNAPAEIHAVVWSIRDERVRELLMQTQSSCSYADMQGAICVGRRPIGLGATMNVQCVPDEASLFEAVVVLFSTVDPAVVLGYNVTTGSVGKLLERAKYLGLSTFAQRIARAPLGDEIAGTAETHANDLQASQAGPARKLYPPELLSGGVSLPGRLVLNVWRIMRSEAKLRTSAVQTAAGELLGETLPHFPQETLRRWWLDDGERGAVQVLHTIAEMAVCNLRLLDALNVLPRAAETARILGIDVLSVLSRGSQYRVEGLLMRAAHRDRLLLLSPSKEQVAGQRSAECIPLVMEPKSGFYFDPVLVLDFQSLYPSIVIAYNICFSTCLGRLGDPLGCAKLGVLEAYQRPSALAPEELVVLPSEAVFAKRHQKCGVLTRMLHEILQTRIMVKKALKDLEKNGESNKAAVEARMRLLDARQFGLKMIANVTYGYTGASFSGRMPCVEVADAIVQTARHTLERAVRWVEQEVSGAEVVYGDTDSLFVRLPGRTKEEAFKEGARIAREVTRQNPRPVELKFDKVFMPCCLVSKKRYIGHAWQAVSDTTPLFDAKGIETVRRDQCNATQNIMRGMLETYFNSNGDLSSAKTYLQQHAERFRSGRFKLQDFIFHMEVRPPDEYLGNGPLAVQAVRRSGMPWPSPGERVSFAIAQGPPGSRLADLVVPPGDITGGFMPSSKQEIAREPLYLDIEYYLSRQIAPSLHRLFTLVRGPDGALGYADVRRWLADGPRLRRRDVISAGSSSNALHNFVRPASCAACGNQIASFNTFGRQRVGAGKRATLCSECRSGAGAGRVAEMLEQRLRWQARLQRCNELCLHCTGSAKAASACRNIHCDVFFRKVNAEVQLQTLPSCESLQSILDDW